MLAVQLIENLRGVIVRYRWLNLSNMDGWGDPFPFKLIMYISDTLKINGYSFGTLMEIWNSPNRS